MASTVLAAGHNHSQACIAAEDNLIDMLITCEVNPDIELEGAVFTTAQSTCLCSAPNKVIMQSSYDSCTGPNAGKDDAHVAVDIALLQKTCAAAVSTTTSRATTFAATYTATINATAVKAIVAPISIVTQAASDVLVASSIPTTNANLYSGALQLVSNLITVVAIAMAFV
ncbi:hypothetical protein BCR33DRAFT_712844 [Rhizoclosmatium globosum]|uniref:Uncharacterized protein n=1 Tax=Rhizoclosmatium globosum TaxID=329046 RepID=A0A1Y2CV34_9FUNG|nr:hypothetical protein BCR33DRAFT_712844 [Rhizoclosmatium globosum]|eukprot:ORY50873.1 hypothetical protein BCR33DRAFT_712844 [Rhizoclosmatium globosum]